MRGVRKVGKKEYIRGEEAVGGEGYAFGKRHCDLYVISSGWLTSYKPRPVTLGRGDINELAATSDRFTQTFLIVGFSKSVIICRAELTACKWRRTQDIACQFSLSRSLAEAMCLHYAVY